MRKNSWDPIDQAEEIKSSICYLAICKHDVLEDKNLNDQNGNKIYKIKVGASGCIAPGRHGWAHRNNLGEMKKMKRKNQIKSNQIKYTNKSGLNVIYLWTIWLSRECCRRDWNGNAAGRRGLVRLGPARSDATRGYLTHLLPPQRQRYNRWDIGYHICNTRRNSHIHKYRSKITRIKRPACCCRKKIMFIYLKKKKMAQLYIRKTHQSSRPWKRLPRRGCAVRDGDSSWYATTLVPFFLSLYFFCCACYPCGNPEAMLELVAANLAQVRQDGLCCVSMSPYETSAHITHTLH